MKTQTFTEFLLEQTPRFDEMIMADIRPTDGWLIDVSTGPSESLVSSVDQYHADFIRITPDWYWSQEAARKSSEGAAFVPSYYAPSERPKRLRGFRDVPVKLNNLSKRWH